MVLFYIFEEDCILCLSRRLTVQSALIKFSLQFFEVIHVLQ